MPEGGGASRPLEPLPQIPPARARARDARLDALRGLALVTIFVNHLPGNAFERLTSRNWGFSDAAEAFVLMSGVAAGLAYGPAFRGSGMPWAGVARVWRRAWTLYLVHLLVTALALAVAAGFALWADEPALLGANKVDVVLARPVEALLAIPLLLHQLSYADILPLYLVLLLAAPGLLWLAWRGPRALLAGSVALWLLAGELRLNLPLWPEGGDGWQFNPLAWQVVFVVGLLVGVAARDGRALVPARRSLLLLAAAMLLLALAWRVVPAVGARGNAALAALEAAGAPWTLVAFHKVWETGPRLVHALALAYVAAAWAPVAQVCAARGAAPFRLLGRHALPVFALGSVLAFVGQGVKARAGGGGLLLDACLIGGGLALLLGLALARERWPG